nr:MAG TPA: hypothetical protein [Caudoviricetes sp.]
MYKTYLIMIFSTISFTFTLQRYNIILNSPNFFATFLQKKLNFFINSL